MLSRGIELGYVNVVIDYFPNAITKLYKINDGEWREYKDPVKVDFGDTLYAKSVDKNGKEGLVLEKVITNGDALTKEAFDGEDETYSSYGKMLIDSSMWGEKISVYFQTFTGNYDDSGVSIYDSSDENLSSSTQAYYSPGKVVKQDMTIPQNASYLVFSGRGSSGIYEITIYDTTHQL